MDVTMSDERSASPDFKIILFLCSWGPHEAYQALQDRAAAIPPEIKMVRIPCTGRISKSLLFKAFEMGADGVALVGCESGTCRYGTGTANAQNNVTDTRGILDLIGLGQERLQLATYMPEQSQELLAFLTTFRDQIAAIGKTPVVHVPRASEDGQTQELKPEILSAHDIYACQDCGKCSSACPLTLSGKPFSPRILAGAVISGDIRSPSLQTDVWACLTCGLCYDRCPSAVNFPEFVRDLRHHLRGQSSECSDAHGGFFHSLMRTMTAPGLKPRHWQWLPDDLKTDRNSKILFFGGCASYFDIFFRTHLGVETRNVLVDAIRLLNFFDIHPALMEEERCCGHDLLWSGDQENCEKLAALNVQAIRDMGVEEVVTACPECYRTLARDYPRIGMELDIKVTHLFDLLEREIDKGAVTFKRMERRLTFQDPCRLSRLEDRADLPRRLIQRLNVSDYAEMSDQGRGAICCGNAAWTRCDSFNKALQVKRIRQAHDTGSDLLVTACPKCQIHLRCAMEDPFRGEALNMEIRDLTSLMAETISWGEQ